MNVLVQPAALGQEVRYGLKSVDQVITAAVEIPANTADEDAFTPTDSPAMTATQTTTSSPENALILTNIAAFDLTATHLISSPYPDLANHLRLEPLDIYSRLLAFALTLLKPVTTDYATAPYLVAFNWTVVFGALRTLCQQHDVLWYEQSFYVVIFRSVRRRDTDPAFITELDQESHREASESGGLLKYWFGSCDLEMRNLATCLWRNRQDAAAGGRGPWHRKARSAARDIYEKIEFEMHRLVIGDGAETWRLDKYVE